MEEQETKRGKVHGGQQKKMFEEGGRKGRTSVFGKDRASPGKEEKGQTSLGTQGARQKKEERASREESLIRDRGKRKSNNMANVGNTEAGHADKTYVTEGIRFA